MDSSSFVSNRLDVFEMYRRYCEIISEAYAYGGDGYRLANGSKKAKFYRNALSQLLELVGSGVDERTPILEDVPALMSRLDLMVDSCEFSRFYNFVFFICRENGQRSITVSRAIMAWKLVLSGRFRLLNQWCSFIEKNQRHNISEDTWGQVLAFSRCVHENLEGYDPEGAWPVIIDEFVEHMYRINGSEDARSFGCSCGLKIFPGAKRKLVENFEDQEFDKSNTVMNSKKRQTDFGQNLVNREGYPPTYDCVEIVKHNNSPLGSSKCAVEGSLSKGFAELLSCLQFDHERRVSYAL
ncbi:Defective-in-cullin neddylation protein [Cynara cardunculus var. scolymus]|uniref:Defective in cullin neddylation protein n=1 Tax=Cynara cardunculus var. scolymus TaxID=59895 RepID=A0A103Y4T2_CYNCS|nr:Defective-in-cullin neddylation protein [Cynara cardunculus var. scolymus]